MLTPSLTKLHMTGEVDEYLFQNFFSGADGIRFANSHMIANKPVPFRSLKLNSIESGWVTLQEIQSLAANHLYFKQKVSILNNINNGQFICSINCIGKPIINISAMFGLKKTNLKLFVKQVIFSAIFSPSVLQEKCFKVCCVIFSTN